MGWTRGHYRGVPRGVCHKERSDVRCRDLPEDRRIVRYPSQEVEQDHGHYYGLPRSDGATWNPSQEVEQGHGVMEPRGICRREWSRIAAVTAARQGAKVYRLKSDRSVWRREVVSHLSKRNLESSFHRSSDGVSLKSHQRAEPGFRRSSGGVFLAVGVVDGARLP